MKSTPILTTTFVLGLTLLSARAHSNDPKEIKDAKDMTQTQQMESDAGFYAGVYGGAEFATNYENKNEAVGTPAGTAAGNSGTFDGWGGVGGIKAGYNFQSWRICDDWKLRWQPAIEAEALYIGTNSSDSFSGGGFAAATQTTYNSAAWFVNGILRIKNASCVTPYLGVGIGGEYLTSHTNITTNIPGNNHITGVSGDDVVFAAQALGGFDIKVTRNWSLFGEYKFIDAFNPNLSSSGAGGTYYHYNPDQIQQHLVVTGVKYSF